MSGKDVEGRIKIALISMGIRPSRKGFGLLAEAIAENTVRGLPMRAIYDKLSKKRHKTAGSIERSMRLCLEDIDEKSFAKQFNDLTGFSVIPASMRFSCNSFIGMMGEIFSIAYRADYNDVFDDVDGIVR